MNKELSHKWTHIIATYPLSHGTVLMIEHIRWRAGIWSTGPEQDEEYRVLVRDYSTDNPNNPLDYGLFRTESLVEALVYFNKHKQEELHEPKT